MKVKERIHRKEEMSSCNVEALTMERFTADWLLSPNFSVYIIKNYFQLSCSIVTDSRSYLCFYSRRWRKNNFLRKSPDDTKKEDNDGNEDYEKEVKSYEDARDFYWIKF